MKRNNFSKMVLTLFASLALVITGTSTVNNKTQQVVKAAEEAVATLTFPDGNSEKVGLYVKTWSAKIDSVEWTIENANNNNNGWSYIKIGIKNAASIGKISTSSLTAQKVSRIVLTIDAITVNSVNSIYLNVKENDSVDEKIALSSPAKGENEFVISNSALNKEYELVFDCKKGSENGFIQVSKVEYFAESGKTPLEIYSGMFKSEATKSQLKLAYSTNPTYSYVNETIAITSPSLSKQMTGDGVNDAKLFGLDENIFSIKSDKEPSSRNQVGLYSEIRIYAKSSLEISLLGENSLIKSVKIETSSNLSNCAFTADEDATIDTNTNTYTYANGTTSFKIANNGKAQIKVTKFEVTYSGMAATYTYDIESTSLRFGTTISKDLYDGLVAEGTNVTFGVISQATSVLGENELTVENAGNTKALTPVRVDTELASEESETGNYYQFAVLFTGLTAADYTTEVTARCYVCIDGTYYYMQAKTCSVKSIAADYLSLQGNNEQVVANSGVLNYLANYTAE